MSGKTVLVTGSAGNLGSAVVRHFLKEGRQVAGLTHHITESVEDPGFKEFEVDLLDETGAAEVVKAIAEQSEGIGTAVLTAGGYSPGKIIDTSAEDLMKMYRLNFETAYNTVRPLLSDMSTRGKGKIFLIGAGTGMDPARGKGAVAYSLSKSLLFQLAAMINADHRQTDIRAFVIVPGTIDTPQNRKAMPDADFSKWQSPDRIAAVIARYSETDNPEKTEIIISQEK